MRSGKEGIAIMERKEELRREEERKEGEQWTDKGEGQKEGE